MRDTRKGKRKVAVKKTAKTRRVKPKPSIAKKTQDTVRSSNHAALPSPAPSDAPEAVSALTPAPTPKRRLAPTPPPLPTVKPILGISVERGVFLMVSTAATDGELSEFRLATEKPFSRTVPADAKRCRMGSTLIKDDAAGSPRRIYVAFVPTPAKVVVSGVTHGCAKHQKQVIYFNFNVERFETFDRDVLRKLLFALHDPFEEVLAAVLPAAASIREEHKRVSGQRERQLRWQSILAQVKEHLENKESAQALALLEPLVFSTAPRPEAEKLLAEILLTATQSRTDGASDALKELQRQKLLMEHLTRRLARERPLP
jgi:hypothetical protein